MEADAIVLLHGLGDAPVYSAFAELTRLAARAQPPRVLIGVATDDPDGAAFTALVKTAALEWSADWKCIAMTQADLKVGLYGREVAAELARGGADREVRLGPVRAVRTRVPAAAASTRRPLTEGTWIVSGGGRGITGICSVALARAGARRIALLGRTTLDDEPAVCRGLEDQAALKRALIDQAGGAPDLRAIGRQASAILAQREIRATMIEIEAAGAEVRYASLDVADDASVRRVIGDLRRTWGPIRGLVHAAGVLADKRLGEKTLEQFSRVLRTKIGGARALLDACADDPLEQICFFSSVAAHAGNAGQSDYAAANAALDRMALDQQARRGADCHVVSIAWGPWDGGMVTASLARHFTARGIGLIPPQAGARALVDELSGGTHTQVIVGCELEQARELEPERIGFARQALPMLTDHRIGGAVDSAMVLPTTMALDTLFGAGRRALGARCEARDLRVLHGVVFDGDRVELELRTEALDSGGLIATLSHLSGRPAYRAEFAIVHDPPPPASPLAKAIAPLPDVCSNPYAAALFHGPAFQVIREVLSCTDATISARIATAEGMGWSAQWQIDPAALDGALQLLRVWGVAQDGRASLPTEIERCRAWAPWPAGGEVGCTVNCRRDNAHRLSGDALFVDLATGAPLLSLDGIVMHIHPQWTWDEDA